jgi:hypothetical protein
MIGCRYCARQIDSGDGIRSTISGFAAFASEHSKAGRLMSDVSLAADINCIVPPLDALRDRTNGFIRERRSFVR